MGSISSVGSFGANVNIWANKTQKNMTGYIQRVCRGVAEEIITTAPCDTGAYIGNWTPSINVAVTSNDFVPGPSKYKGRTIFKGGMTSVNRERAIAHVRRKLDFIIPLVNAYNGFFFSNGVRHVRYVEYGGGNTPPYQIVKKAMNKFKRQLAQSASFGSGKWGGMWTWKS